MCHPIRCCTALAVALGLLSLLAYVTVRSEGSCSDDDGGDDPPRRTARLRLSTPKSEFFRLEPVPVRCAIQNTSDRDIYFSDLRQSTFAELLMFVTRPDGVRLDRRSPENPRYDRAITIILKPQETLDVDEILHYSADWGPIFDRVGEYHIQAETKGGAKSNVVTIHVTEPPQAEQAAMRLFDDYEEGRFVLGFSDDEKLARQFEALVRGTPNSTYAPYARLALGKFYLRRSRFDDGVQALEQLLERAPEFPLRPDVEYLIAKADHDHAVRRFEAIVREHPDWTWSHHIRRFLDTNSRP